MTEKTSQIIFNDGKAQDAMRTIGEVSSALGIRQHVLRYWEEQFPMLRPLKRSGGRRYYRPEDIQLVATIDRLVHREGYTLRGARLAIAGGKQATAAPAPTLQIDSGILPQLHAIRDGMAPAADDTSIVLPQLQAIRDGLAAALAAG